MYADVDVEMQMNILTHVNAYAYIYMHGMHIPHSGGAHPGDPTLRGGREQVCEI